MNDAERRYLAAGLTACLLVLATLFFVLPSGRAGASPASSGGAEMSFEQRCGGVGSSSVSVHANRGSYDIRVKQGRCRLDIEMDGDVEFLPDESGVASLGRRARLEITEKVGGDERRIVVTPGDGGEPVYEWSVDGRAAEFDGAARDWLRRILPEIFRTTGIDAEARVGRILERDGVDGVLHEVTLVSGDHTQRVYLEELLRQAKLDRDQLEEALEMAGREIGSDFELAELLIGTAPDLDAESLRLAYSRAAEEIGSDFEMRRALTALVQRQDLGDESLDLALRTARSIGSDFELAEFLIAVAGKRPEGRPLPASYAEAVRTIGSDFEQRRALQALLERDPQSPETLDMALATATEIGSDFELAEFLVGMAKAYPEGRPLPASFFAAARTIGSDFEMRRTLNAVVASRNLGPETVQALLETSLEVGSDFEMAEFLVALARAHALGDAERPAFRRALDSVGSKYERERVLSELGDRRRLD